MECVVETAYLVAGRLPHHLSLVCHPFFWKSNLKSIVGNQRIKGQSQHFIEIGITWKDNNGESWIHSAFGKLSNSHHSCIWKRMFVALKFRFSFFVFLEFKMNCRCATTWTKVAYTNKFLSDIYWGTYNCNWQLCTSSNTKTDKICTSLQASAAQCT